MFTNDINTDAHYFVYNQRIPFIEENSGLMQLLHGPSANIYLTNDSGMHFVGTSVFVNNNTNPTCRIQFREKFQYLENNITYVDGWSPIGKCITCNYPHRKAISDESTQRETITRYNTCRTCWLNYDRDDWHGDSPTDFLEPSDDEDSEEEDQSAV